MSFCCPIHGYYTPIAGATTVAICPACAREPAPVVAGWEALIAERDRYREALGDLAADFLAYAGPDAERSGYYRIARQLLTDERRKGPSC